MRATFAAWGSLLLRVTKPCKRPILQRNSDIECSDIASRCFPFEGQNFAKKRRAAMTNVAKQRPYIFGFNLLIIRYIHYTHHLSVVGNYYIRLIFLNH